MPDGAASLRRIGDARLELLVERLTHSVLDGLLFNKAWHVWLVRAKTSRNGRGIVVGVDAVTTRPHGNEGDRVWQQSRHQKREKHDVTGIVAYAHIERAVRSGEQWRLWAALVA